MPLNPITATLAKHSSRKRSAPRLASPVGLRGAAAVALLLLAFSAAVPARTPGSASGALETSPRQQQVMQLAVRFAERAHYSHVNLDDRLSEAVLDSFIESLDVNRQYFLEPDIAYFNNKYRHSLDDVLRTGQLEPVFDIFRLYRMRAQQNLAFALSQLQKQSDFSAAEDFVFDRDKLPWISTAAAMQDYWRRRVKNDALGLLMADKTWPQAADVLKKRYERVLKRVNELDGDDVFESFMNSFARALDPHSSYMSPRQSEEYRIQMSLSYQGIGASLQLNDELVTVLNIIPGGPAAIDGHLKTNDRITAVGQGSSGELTDVVGWQLDDVVQLIRGPQGTTVRLQVLPADAPPGAQEQTLALVRDKVKLEEQAAKSSVMEIKRGSRTMKIGIIAVPSFYQDFEARSRGDEDYVSTTRDVRRLLGELTKQNVEGIVMDLRGNGGGHLTEATSLTGLFLDAGPVVQLKDTSGRVEVLDDPLPSAVYTGPLAVLVDRFSASASEIFAAAIQDYRRGVVIGQQTFGKGTVQNLYPLDQYARHSSENSLGQLTLTIGKFYRVTGGSTQHKGVLPDIALPSPVDPTLIGESSRGGALPWDQIDPTRYRPNPPLDAAIAYLTQNESTRMRDDADARFLQADAQALSALRSQKAVSLNLAVRTAEREKQRKEQLARENTRRASQGLPALQSMEKLKPDELPDVLLGQATQIMADYVRLGRPEKALAASARPN